MRRWIGFILVLLAVMQPGCKKDSRPEGLPDLYPFTIKILQEGSPVEGASVNLASTDPALMKWPCGGMTGADGVATMNTYGFPGAPAGSFKVVVSKTVEEGGAATDEESAQMMIEGQEISAQMFDLIDPIYKFDTKTSLTVEVQASKSNAPVEFEVGAATHEAVRM